MQTAVVKFNCPKPAVPGSAEADDHLVRVRPVAISRTEDRSGLVSRLGALCVALALHGIALSLFILSPQNEPISGAGGTHLEAINIEIVTTRVIESSKTEKNISSGGAQLPIAPTAGDENDSSVAKLNDAAKAHARPLKPDERDEEQIPSALEQQRVDPHTKGGDVSRSDESSTHPNGTASASPGAIQKYAAQIRAILAKNKPEGKGHRGVATIAFAIDLSGKTVFSTLSESSGNATIDEAALNAVRQARFPRPPDRMTNRQLTFVVPFKFK